MEAVTDAILRIEDTFLDHLLLVRWKYVEDVLPGGYEGWGPVSS